jgi:nitrogen fixation protein NifX
MSYKIAAASSDGKVVNQHFGRTKQFVIFEVNENGGYVFLENRENAPPCNLGEHSTNAMLKAVDLLSDCKIVIVSQIGPVAEEVLNKKGIKAIVISDFIENAITKIISYNAGNQEEQSNN